MRRMRMTPGSIAVLIFLVVTIVGFMLNIASGDNVVKTFYEEYKDIFYLFLVFLLILAVLLMMRSNPTTGQSIGVVQPTKSPSPRPTETQSAQVGATATLAPLTSLSSIPTTPAPSPLTTSARIVELRKQHNLRALGELEDGLTVNRLPNGIYGFIFTDEFDGAAGRNMSEYATLRSQLIGDNRVEIHKLEDGRLLVVGFVSPQDAVRLQDPSKVGITDVLFMPREYGIFTELVSIPTAQLRSVSSRSGGPGIFDLQIDTSAK